jgi:hypothetical protein
MTEPLDNLYFNWLCAKVLWIEVPTPSLKFDKLFRILYNTEFVWLIPGDDDRAEDGVELRQHFLDASLIASEHHTWTHLSCSVFEMLLAFSQRCEFATDVAFLEWFWEFIRNLGLSTFNDATYDEDWTKVDEILYNFVWRQYDYNGQGGICPLEISHRDQTEVEVWYQFCDYLVDQNRMP